MVPLIKREEFFICYYRIYFYPDVVNTHIPD
jgi:hypothetical protein